jgi:hypothetical protein
VGWGGWGVCVGCWGGGGGHQSSSSHGPQGEAAPQPAPAPSVASPARPLLSELRELRGAAQAVGWRRELGRQGTARVRLAQGEGLWREAPAAGMPPKASLFCAMPLECNAPQVRCPPSAMPPKCDAPQVQCPQSQPHRCFGWATHASPSSSTSRPQSNQGRARAGTWESPCAGLAALANTCLRAGGRGLAGVLRACLRVQTSVQGIPGSSVSSFRLTQAHSLRLTQLMQRAICMEPVVEWGPLGHQCPSIGEG